MILLPPKPAATATLPCCCCCRRLPHSLLPLQRMVLLPPKPAATATHTLLLLLLQTITPLTPTTPEVVLLPPVPPHNRCPTACVQPPSYAHHVVCRDEEAGAAGRTLLRGAAGRRQA